MIDEAAGSPSPVTAGTLLRHAREAQGLHIAALAAALKVPQRKLEALERDEYGALPDPSFTRALALSVCRSLKIDSAPVLALLPKTEAAQLEQVAGRGSMPFRDREGSSGPVAGGLLGRPVPWIVLLLLLGALALAFWPANKTVVEPAPVPSAAPAESIALPPPTPAASDVDAVAAPAEDAGASAPSAVASAAEAGADTVAPSASAPALVSAGPLVLRASAPSWIQVSGGDGRTLLSRTLEKDETVSLDGALPMRLIIGNAAATEVVLRGVPVDLAPHTRENIARFELP